MGTGSIFHSQKVSEAYSVNELIHKAVRKKYDVKGSNLQKIKKHLLKNTRLFAIGYNGKEFVGIKLTANEQTKKMEGLKTWTAVLDSETCDSCMRMNGQTVPIYEPFIFNSKSKKYKLNEPPLHGFNLIGDKKISNAMPGTENDEIGRFEQPTCRCMAIYAMQTSDEQKHFDDRSEVEFIEEEDEKENQFLLDVVYPIDSYWNANPDKISEQAWMSIAEHYSDKIDRDLLIIEMKERGPIDALKYYKLI